MSTSISVTPKKKEVGAPPVRSFGHPLSAAWLRCSESRAITYSLFAIAYIIPTVWLIRHKLMWDDEFFTLYVSKTMGWSDLWRALKTGADQHPHSFYYLTHVIFKVAGTSHLTLRLTALLGFGLCCLCLYEIARHVVGRRWGLAAMLLPLTTPALYYATEARGYGIQLGFITFSILMWIWATQGRKRALTVPLLAIGLCFAVASHYYAVLFLVPLGIGELVKIIKRRSIDLPVCCALLAALVPLLLFAQLILGARSYSSHFWAVPHAGSMLLWYENMLGRAPLILLAVSGVVYVLRTSGRDDSSDAALKIDTPIMAMLTASALLPVIGGITAEVITQAYSARYFIAGLPGCLMILLWAMRRVLRNDTAGPALAAALCTVLFIVEWRGLRMDEAAGLEQMRSSAALLRQVPDFPVVIDLTAFHQLSYYGKRDLANRLVYVADPHLSVRYLGHDTIDRGALDLTPWFPVRVAWWHDWWKAHSFSLVYANIGHWSWNTFALGGIGKVQVIGRSDPYLLFAVTRTKIPDDDRLGTDPSGAPRLYDRLPVGGPTLCKLYMPNDVCPVVDDPRFQGTVTPYPNLDISTGASGPIGFDNREKP